MKSKLENVMAANDGGNDESGAYHRSVRHHWHWVYNSRTTCSSGMSCQSQKLDPTWQCVELCQQFVCILNWTFVFNTDLLRALQKDMRAIIQNTSERHWLETELQIMLCLLSSTPTHTPRQERGRWHQLISGSHFTDFSYCLISYLNWLTLRMMSKPKTVVESNTTGFVSVIQNPNSTSPPGTLLKRLWASVSSPVK